MIKKQIFKQLLISLILLMVVGLSIPKDIKAETVDDKPLHTLSSGEENSSEKSLSAPPLHIPQDESNIDPPGKPVEPTSSDEEEPSIGEVVEMRTEDTKTFYDGRGSYRKQIFFQPVHRKKSGKKVYEEISPGVMEDETDRDSLETENTAIETKFKKKMKNGQYARFTSKGHTLDFSILQASGENKPTLDVTDAVAKFKKKSNKIVHENIFPDINLRNILFDQNVKEDIVLNKYNGYNQFTFKIETDLIAKKTDEGSITFVDENQKEVFNVPAPTMSDSNVDPKSGDAASSDDVSFTLDKINKGYKLTLVADSTWLEDPTRKYPVYIDPTTSIGITTDTYVSSATPDTNYEKNKFDSALGEYVLRTGYYSSSTGTNYAYLKNPIASISGKLVQSATLNVYVTHAYYANGTKNGLWIAQNDEPLSLNSVTWNTKPSSTHIISTNVGINSWASFNVSSTVKGWADGSKQNNGFMLNTAGHGQEYWKKLTSSENSVNKPYLSVTYTDLPPGEVNKPFVITKNTPGKDTGEVELYWDPVPGAEKYVIGIFNGKNYTEIPTNSNADYWTSKGKGIWPRQSEIEQGRYQLHTNGGGTELPIDPRGVYTNGYNNNPEFGDYREVTTLYMYVRAVNSAGAGEVSDVVTPTIPLETPTIHQLDKDSAGLDSDKGSIDIEWGEIPGAEGYRVWLFNGYNYQSFDIEDNTYWTSLGEGLYPTIDEINQGRYQFHTDGSGDELQNRPWNLYRNGYNAGGLYGNYSNYNNYWVTVSAYVGGKNSESAIGVTPSIPVETLIEDTENRTVYTSHEDGKMYKYVETTEGDVIYTKVYLLEDGKETLSDEFETTVIVNDEQIIIEAGGSEPLIISLNEIKSEIEENDIEPFASSWVKSYGTRMSYQLENDKNGGGKARYGVSEKYTSKYEKNFDKFTRNVDSLYSQEKSAIFGAIGISGITAFISAVSKDKKLTFSGVKKIAKGIVKGVPLLGAAYMLWDYYKTYDRATTAWIRMPSNSYKW